MCSYTEAAFLLPSDIYIIIKCFSLPLIGWIIIGCRGEQPTVTQLTTLLTYFLRRSCSLTLTAHFWNQRDGRSALILLCILFLSRQNPIVVKLVLWQCWEHKIKRYTVKPELPLLCFVKQCSLHQAASVSFSFSVFSATNFYTFELYDCIWHIEAPPHNLQDPKDPLQSSQRQTPQDTARGLMAMPGQSSFGYTWRVCAICVSRWF